jgi:hypothetical protein
MHKNLYQVLIVETLRERTANEAIAGSEGVCGLKSGSWFCVCIWQKYDFKRRDDVYTFNLLYKDIL